MTGNSNLLVVYNNGQPSIKWLVHKKNVTRTRFYNYLPFYNSRLSTHGTKDSIINLWDSYLDVQQVKTTINFTDRFRPLTLEEYEAFNNELLLKKLRYNKKTDKLFEL